jgi:hypothetical protein
MGVAGFLDGLEIEEILVVGFLLMILVVLIGERFYILSRVRLVVPYPIQVGR